MDWADTVADDGDSPKEVPAAAVASPTEEREPLPDIEVRGPDAMGNKSIIEWYYNDENQRVRKTTKVKVTQKAAKIKRSVLERRPQGQGGNAKLFGKAVTQGNGGGITRIDSETSITVTARVKEEAMKAAFESAWKQKKQASAQKWVSSRDYSKKDGDEFWDAARKEFYGDSAPSGELGMKMSNQGGANAYRAPARREGASASLRDGDRFGRPGGDLATVRITNLSEEATEDDVKRLCQAFGNTQRIYLAKDKYTQASKGFAFVNFHRRDSAEKAIEKLNGYGYDNLILHVEWAKPSEDRKDRERPLIGSVAAGTNRY